MSWLRTTSLSFARQLSRSLDPRHDYEPGACYNSFCRHWQQAHDIIVKSQPQHLHDDVLAVVNHVEQLSTLLVLEARARQLTPSTASACLEHLLSEGALHELFQWGTATGKYENAVQLEQLKLYGVLVSHYSSQVIAAEPFLRPLLKLLSGFRNELPPLNVETQLVAVLNQLCVALMQNIKFLDLFFLTDHTQDESQSEFIIVRLLLSSVHRSGQAGSAARDALLLCAKMSARSQQLAEYMLATNTCPVLATGLSGLYSLLPRTLGDIVRLTPDDVNQVNKLTLFIDSLEFCNAVAQVAHPSITKHLLDLLYQGFLVPVMGPALLQNREGTLQSGAPEQTAAMAYLEVSLRCAAGPRPGAEPGAGLLRTALHFLTQYAYDGVRLLDVLLGRLEGDTQLSLVALSLVETLIDLNSEDVMLELIFKYLLNGYHLSVPHRQRISEAEPYREAAVSFLSLTPRCCARPLEKTREYADNITLNGRRVLEFRKEDEGRKHLNGVNETIAMDNLVNEVKFNYGNPNETLFGNYHAYLCDARFEIVSRTIACAKWTSKYDSVTQQKRETNNNSKDTKEIDIPNTNMKEQDSLISVCTSGYETLKTSDTSEKEPHSLTSLVEDIDTGNIEIKTENQTELNKEHDSLTSFGESSGYESFRYRMEENEENEVCSEESFWKSVRKTTSRQYEPEVPLVRTWKARAESIIGPLLNSVLKKAAALLESDIAQNCRVTAIISKLVSLPTPLLMSLLLCPGTTIQPNVPSLFQILSKLKEEVDELTSSIDNTQELVDRARIFLIQREMALVRPARAHGNDDGNTHSPDQKSEDQFRRGESKRRSLSTSISNMFGRRLSSSSPSSPQSLNSSISNSSPQKRPVFTQESYWNQSITLRSILNAVILDEWIKELAALSEEHALRLSAESYEDDAYIRSVAL